MGRVGRGPWRVSCCANRLLLLRRLQVWGRGRVVLSVMHRPAMRLPWRHALRWRVVRLLRYRRLVATVRHVAAVGPPRWEVGLSRRVQVLTMVGARHVHHLALLLLLLLAIASIMLRVWVWMQVGMWVWVWGRGRWAMRCTVRHARGGLWRLWRLWVLSCGHVTRCSHSRRLQLGHRLRWLLLLLRRRSGGSMRRAWWQHGGRRGRRL